MNEDIRNFLRKFSMQELEGKNVLLPDSRFGYLLRAGSVTPLIELMKTHNITRLEAPDRHWFLTADYEFQNPRSAEAVSGDVRHLSNSGNVFNEQNRYINPYFGPSYGPRGEGIDEGTKDAMADAEVITFGLERDLQSALRSHIEQLEAGLRIVDGGTERTVEAGRIDITAEDRQGWLVVIELKAGTAPPDSLTQLLAYMGALGKEEQKPVRGILVARDFHKWVSWAAQTVPNVQLKEYSFHFSFKNPLIPDIS